MTRLPIDFDEIQKAMEDTVRDAFDYFLDKETGDVVILSEDILSRARFLLEDDFDDDMADYEEIEFDREHSLPDWMEDEIELALSIFLEDKDRYARIPERSPADGYAAMRMFTDGIEDSTLKEKLSAVIDGKGAFRRFKDVLDPYPKEKKMWYGLNAKMAKIEIERWLRSLGLENILPLERQGGGAA